MVKSQRPRAASLGDRSPVLSARGIEEYEVGNAMEGAKLAMFNAVRDVLEHADRDELASVASWLNAVLAGTSPDDAAALRRVIAFEDSVMFSEPRSSADDELADGWPNCVYPYKHLMSRKQYEREKYRLQVELLKLQAWVKESGERVVTQRPPLRPAPHAVHEQGCRAHRWRRPSHRRSGELDLRTGRTQHLTGRARWSGSARR